MLRKSPFIIPSAPVLAKAPPAGPEWLHEVKFDGWRAQLHLAGDDVILFTRNGNDVTRRFRPIAAGVAALPARSAIIDAEIVVCDDDDRPSFGALMAGQQTALCAWCFDLMELNSHDLRSEPLDSRRERLRQLLLDAGNGLLRFSDDFPDPQELLAAADRMGLEGIVSKRRDEFYRSSKKREPIHVPGSIQPYGLLFVVDETTDLISRSDIR